MTLVLIVGRAHAQVKPAQLYVSAIIMSQGGPWIVTPWLAVAQIMTSLYLLHLPYEYHNELDKQWLMADGYFPDEEEMVSKKQETADLRQYRSFSESNLEVHGSCSMEVL
ncbi:hypothetical protein FGRMN_9184 [Fusarium graminum]|nr:hypothetical protein FGRMN_9184 [Fusarium graminum]